MSEINVLLLGDASSESIVAALATDGRKVMRVADPGELLQLAPEHQVIIVDVVPLPRTAVSVCRELRAVPELADRPILVIAGSDDVEERIRLLEAGADDVLARPVDERELDARVEALDLRYRHSAELRPDIVMTTTKREGHRLVVVLSPKGGVGTTTVAVNLALAINNRMPQGVAIIDLDTGVGHVATHLDVRPRQTITELGHDTPAHTDIDLLRTYLVRHDSGVQVLAGPLTPALESLPSANVVTNVLETLLLTFAVVIVDGGSVVDDRLVTALERADDVIIVVSPDFPALKSVHAMFDYLRERGTTIPEPTIVLNELFAREMLTIADIEGALLKKVAVRIPYDPELYLRAVNEGTPVAAAAPASPPARRIDQLATLLVGVDAPAATLQRRRGVLGALLGRS